MKKKDEVLDWLVKEWMKSNSRKAIRQRRKEMFNIGVGLETWNYIKNTPEHPFHYSLMKQIRRDKLLWPWRKFVRWFREVTGIERRYYAKLRARYPRVVPEILNT